MTRTVVMALLGACIVVALGYVVYSRTLDGPAEPQRQAPVQAAPEARPGPEPAKLPHATVTTVTAVTGRVEKSVGTTWSELEVGDVLTARDTIRTAEGARATLDAGVIVEVDDRTELTVGEINDSLSQLALAEGRITASAGTSGLTVRISTRNSDAVAEASSGSFDVLASRSGEMTVAAREGDVRLTAQHDTVTVGVGQQSSVVPGHAPTKPVAIPPSLFLKVAANHKATTSTLRGEATPGSVVSVNGVRTAIAAADGAFTAVVPVRKGDTKIVVQVEDVLGRRDRRVLPRRLDAPKLDTKVEWQ